MTSYGFSDLLCCFIGLVLIWLNNSLNIGKTMTPKTANEVKLMCFGKILENSKTVGQCKLPFGDVGGGGVMVMHVVVQPTIDKAKSGMI